MQNTNNSSDSDDIVSKSETTEEEKYPILQIYDFNVG